LSSVDVIEFRDDDDDDDEDDDDDDNFMILAGIFLLYIWPYKISHM